MLKVTLILLTILVSSSFATAEDEYLDCIKNVRTIYDCASLDLVPLLQDKKLPLVLAEIIAKNPMLLGDIRVDNNGNGFLPFHRPAGEPPADVRHGSIHILRVFGVNPNISELPYVFQQPLNFPKHSPRVLLFSPYSFTGTWDALVVLSSSSPGTPLHDAPKTYLLPAQMLTSISEMNPDSFLGSVSSAREKISSEEKLGQIDKAVEEAFNSGSNPLIALSNIQFLVNTTAITSYDSLKQLLFKTRDKSILFPQAIYYLILTKAASPKDSVTLENLIKYINEDASPLEAKAFAWAYLTRYQSQPGFDPSNQLQSALLKKIEASDGAEVIRFLNEKHPFPQ